MWVSARRGQNRGEWRQNGVKVSRASQSVCELVKKVTLSTLCHSVIASVCDSFARHLLASSGLFQASKKGIRLFHSSLDIRVREFCNYPLRLGHREFEILTAIFVRSFAL
jgi:hypothetical protein